ncbi:MAG: NAD(P)-dependent oxidoreductase [Hydrogenophaga sp.]|uniref:NAD(P)-dependent oxidoreductase n=1 Tax=Hydrogenophaga sp. TaxID=1904254 RepID=UPI003D0A204F
MSGAPVGVIGAGNMGGAMVERLREAGWAVTVCDIDPLRQRQAMAAGASLADSPEQVARTLGPGHALIVVVVDTAQVREVLWGPRGAAQALQRGQTVLLCPTIAPQDVEAIAGDLERQGVDCIDAPLSGGPVRARDGRMSLMVAGPEPVLASQAALLSALSDHVMRISDRVGDGARTKLVNNLLAGINLVGAAEALAMAERLGLDLSTTLDVIERSSGQSWVGSDRMRRAVAGDFAPRAHVTLLEKDTRLAVAAGRAAGFEGPLGARAARVFEQAHEAGMAALDDGALLKLLRQAPPSKP